MSTQQDQIDLGPLFEPDPVQFQFETPGWYVLLALLIVGAAFIAFRLLRSYVRNAYRRQAIELLDAIQNRFQEKADVRCITDVMVLLKQVSITTYNREKVAALYGDKWISFLESTSNNISFKSHEVLISEALYQNELSHVDQVLDFFSSSKKWIRTHA